MFFFPVRAKMSCKLSDSCSNHRLLYFLVRMFARYWLIIFDLIVVNIYSNIFFQVFLSPPSGPIAFVDI